MYRSAGQLMVCFTVFGATGFIGSKLCKHLRNAGYDVLTPSREEGMPKNPGHVVYAIGLTGDFRHRPHETVEAHVCKLNGLLQQGGFDSFLYLSSTRVYGGSREASEDSPLPIRPSDPDHLYNATKLVGESLTLTNQALNTRVVRLSNVVGPGEVGRDTFVGALIRESSEGLVRLRTHPASEKDYIWIDDVLPRLEAIVLRGEYRLYNLATGRQLRHDDWTQKLAETTGCDIHASPEAPMTSFPGIDVRRLSAEFGVPQTNPIDRIAEILGPAEE